MSHLITDNISILLIECIFDIEGDSSNYSIDLNLLLGRNMSRDDI